MKYKQPAHLLGLCLVSVIAFTFAGCAALPSPLSDIAWVDLWGDRGRGVLERDYGMCAELVEQRRSLLSGCMASRGWSTDATR
jgi:hypothetical protein